MSNGSRRWQPPHVDPAKARTQAPPTKATVKPLHLCTWRDCEQPHAPLVGIPLCLDHARKAADAYQRLMAHEEQQWRTEAEAKINSGLRLAPGETVPGWVYYVEMDSTIKIGYTTNIDTRMRAYPPTAKLLAVEPGTRALERGRHSIFNAHLAHGREWFNDHPDIRTWIATVREVYGEPSDKAYYRTPTEKKPIVGGKHANRRW